MIGGMDVEAMPDHGWSRAFDEPIPLPDGGELRTLLDAGRYVDALPRSMHEREAAICATGGPASSRSGLDPS